MSGFAAAQDDAIALLDRWSAAYITDDPEAIRKYFSRLKGSGNQNTIEDRRVIVLGEDAVLGTGFYEFSGPQDGKMVPKPSRFTMVMIRRGGEWRIANHHSSPHVQSSN